MKNSKIKLFLLQIFLTMSIIILIEADDSKHEQMKEMLKNMAEDCMRNTSANDAELDNMVERKPAQTKEGKCLRSCMLVQFEIMEEGNGKFNDEGFDKLIAMITQNDTDKMEKLKSIYKICTKAAENEQDHCEKAELYMTCFDEEVKRQNLKIDHDEQ